MGSDSQDARFLAGWEEREAGKIPRRQDGCFHRLGYSHPHRRRYFYELACRNGENRCRLIDNLYPGRERSGQLRGLRRVNASKHISTRIAK